MNSVGKRTVRLSCRTAGFVCDNSAVVALGRLDTTVTADTPHYAVFQNDDGTYYVFYNPDSVAKTVRFSDGYEVLASPRQVGAELRLATSVHADLDDKPASPSSLTVAPNPFNPSTTFRFPLTHPAAVSLKIYDICGRLVATLLDEGKASGEHSIGWDGRDEHGKALPTGVYLSRLEIGDRVLLRKVVMLR